MLAATHLMFAKDQKGGLSDKYHFFNPSVIDLSSKNRLWVKDLINALDDQFPLIGPYLMT